MINVKTIISNNAISSQMGSNCLFINEMNGKDGDLHFDVDWTGSRTYRASDLAQLGLPINVLDNIPVDRSKCTFLHIYCFNSSDGVQQTPHPVKFLLRANGVILGYMSQFELGNIEQLSYDVIIEDVQMTEVDQVELIIVVGAKL